MIYFSHLFKRAQVEERRIVCPAARTPVRVLFVSDVHYSRMFPERALDNLMEQIASLGPELILWGGDYAETPEYQKGFFRAVRRLSPRMGMAGVVGNNDSRCFAGDTEAMKEIMRAGGVTPLINDTWDIPMPHGRLRIGGLDERLYGHPDISGLFPTPQDRDFRICIAHYPGVMCKAAQALAPQVALSGHTHGGQFSLFGLTPYSLGFERGFDAGEAGNRAQGWWREGNTDCLISAGIGVSRLPLRVGVPPKMHVITLENG